MAAKDAQEVQDTAGPDIVLDLMAEEAPLREGLAKPTHIRLPTGAEIDIPSMGRWKPIANRLAALGSYDAWAISVFAEDAPALKAWQEANMENFLINRIFEVINAAAGANPGK